ncbi:MAG: hypothetical protein IT462_07205 [Planctomycetes bacterium]|nr:hypothetical protein [Planctomycetota bacterium]
MIRKTSLVFAALAAICALATSTDAQPANRNLELRVFKLCRGYLRPMTATANRLREIKALDTLTPAGHSEGVTRFKLTTAMQDSEVAEALGLSLIHAEGDVLELAPQGSDDAGMEARPKLLDIVQAIRARVVIDENGSAVPIFSAEETKSTAACLAKLGLKPARFDGEFFKQADYHIEQTQFAGIYTIWAGKAYAGLPVAAPSLYGIKDERASLEPDQESPFVGCKLAMGRWTNGFFWVDPAGCELNDYGFDRSATIAKPRKELAVQAGAKRVRQLLLAAAKMRQSDDYKDKEAKDLPTGFLSDWSLTSALKLDNKNRDYSLWQHYPDESFHLGWIEDGGKVKARVRAHHAVHPLYLDGAVDAGASLEGVSDKDPSTLKMEWLVAPEESAEVFRARADEADKTFGVISAALFEAGVDSLDGLWGKLNGPALKVLKVAEQTLRGASFGARDYSISRQMLDDVVIEVGSAATGGRRWQLLDVKNKKVIRTGQ